MKTRRFHSIIMVAAALFVFNGCGAYNPQCVDIPLIERKGEVKLEGGAVVLDKTLVGHISTAAGVTDHIAIQGHIHGLANKSGLRIKYMQLATGYYNKMGRLNTELYLGYGFNTFAYTLESDADPHPYGREDGNNHIAFAQFNCGWNHLANSHIDIAFGLKVGYMHDSRIRTNYYYDWYYNDNLGRWSTEYSIVGNRLLLEPTAEIRIGWTHFKPSLMIGYYHAFPDDYMTGLRLSIRLGLTYRF